MSEYKVVTDSTKDALGAVLTLEEETDAQAIAKAKDWLQTVKLPECFLYKRLADGSLSEATRITLVEAVEHE